MVRTVAVRGPDDHHRDRNEVQRNRYVAVFLFCTMLSVSVVIVYVIVIRCCCCRHGVYDGLITDDEAGDRSSKD